MREIADDELCLVRAEAMQILKHELAVVERTKRVDNYYVIERSRQ